MSVLEGKVPILPGLNVEASRTCAVVVGVDRYELVPRLNLLGPARSARRFAEILLARGVPASHIFLFLSTRDDATAAAGQEAVPALPAQVPQGDHIYQVFDGPSLRLRQGGDLLVVYWAGHGVRTTDGVRRLFCSDARPENLKHLHLESLRRYLRSSHGPRFNAVVLFIDACAAPIPLGTGWPERTFPLGEDRFGARQFTLVAARAGQLARPNPEVEMGRFSEHLFALLNGPEDLAPASMDELARRLQDRFEDDFRGGRAPQTPVYFECRAWDPDGGFEYGVWPPPPPAEPRAAAPAERGPMWARFLAACSPRCRSWLVGHDILPSPPLLQAERAYLQWLITELTRRNFSKIVKIPLDATNPTSPAEAGDYSPAEAPDSQSLVRHVRRLLWEVKGISQGGDQATARLAAGSRASRLVRNVVRFLESTRAPVVILGDPGSGKSTTLRDVGIRLAEHGLCRIPALIPVYVPLGIYRKAFDGDTPATVIRLIEHCIPDPHSAVREALSRLRDEQRLAVLFDGMDEMERGKDRSGRSLYTLRVEKLSAFASDFAPQVRTLFACRMNELSHALKHRQMVLLPFDRRQVLEYIRENFPLPLVIDGVSYDARRLARKLLESRELEEMVSNPLTLHLIRHFTVTKSRWPAGRKELFATYVDSLLYRLGEYEKRAGLVVGDRDEVLEGWSAFAFEIARDCGGVFVEVGRLRRLWGHEYAATVLDTGQYSGLLTVEYGGESPALGGVGAGGDDPVELSDEDSVGFFHHRLQEYLAAVYLSRHYETEGGLAWDELIDSPRWQETLLNLIAIGGRESGALRVLEQTLDEANAEYEEIRTTRQAHKEKLKRVEEELKRVKSEIAAKELKRVKSEIAAIEPESLGSEYSPPTYSSQDQRRLKELNERRLKELNERRSGLEQKIEDLRWQVPPERESTIADRVVLTAQLIGEAGPSNALVLEQLGAKLAAAVGHLAEMGRPTSQVKMLWAWKAATDVISLASLRPPFRSPIGWVREQAILTFGTLAACRKLGAGNLGDELAFDLAANDLYARLRTYWMATEGRRGDRALVAWTLLCNVACSLCVACAALGIGWLTASSLPDSFWQSVPLARRAGAAAGFVTIAGTAAALTAVFTFARGPGVLRLYALFTGLVSCVSIFIAQSRCVPINLMGQIHILPPPDGSPMIEWQVPNWLAPLAPMAAMLPALGLSFLVAFLAANIPAIVAGRGTFRRRCTILGGHRNWAVERVGGVAWLAAGAVLLVSLVSRVLVCVAETWTSRTSLIVDLAAGVGVVVALIHYRRTIRENARTIREAVVNLVGCLLIIMIVALLLSIFMYFIDTYLHQFINVLERVRDVVGAGVTACTMLFFLFWLVASWAGLMYRLARYYVLLLLGPRWRAYLLLWPPVRDISPDAWVEEFKNADTYAQAYLLLTTDAKSLGVSPEEFLTILRQCERKVQPMPASSIYWQKCQEFHETVKQEREGRLQRQKAEQAAPDQEASD